MRIIKTLLTVLLLGCKMVFAQYFTTGENPAGIRWKQINTSFFQIIFPEDFEKRAQQLANILDTVYPYGYRTLDRAPGKIPVILHTHTVYSNGMVPWAPRRVELFTTPHQNMYAADWLEQLAVHEFRHVVQWYKVHSEMPRFIRILLGEHAAPVIMGLYLPFWFIEGDAVMTETALTGAGRGRLPSFLMRQKAQVLEKGLFSYDKALLGSYNDLVPDRYSFGYWFAGRLRQEYGPQIWSEAVAETAQRPLSLSPVNRVLKKYSGLGKAKNYSRIFQDYSEEWKAEVASLQLTDNRIFRGTGSRYTDYRYISALSEDALIAVRESRHDIARVVKVEKNKETVIYTPGNILGESFSRTGPLMIWSEQRRHLRWTLADRSVIVVFDAEKGTLREIHPENMIHSPVISPDLKTFAAVETDRSGCYYLSVFDLETGKRMQRFNTQANDYFFTPTWDLSGESLYFIGLSSEGKYLGQLALEDNNMTMLMEPSFHDIRNPLFNDGKLFFTYAITGTDNIFCLDLTTRQIRQITSVPFGADYPDVAGNTLFFSNYSSNGYHIAHLSLGSSDSTLRENLKLARYELAETLARQENKVLDFTVADSAKNYVSTPYRRFVNMVNFHSWAPVFIDPFNYEVKPGVSLVSQNKLGTAAMMLGYSYDLNDRTGRFHAGFNYSGLFPVFRVEAFYGGRKSEINATFTDVIAPGDTAYYSGNLRYSWKEMEGRINTHIPLYFNRGKRIRLIQPELEYSYYRFANGAINRINFFDQPDAAARGRLMDRLEEWASGIGGNYQTLSYHLFLVNRLRMAELDIYPRWGQSLSLVYRHSPGGSYSVGTIKGVVSTLFFPGFASNHGISVYNGYQVKETDKAVTFSDIVRFPRGIGSMQNTRLYSAGMDYAMPIAYPDVGVGRFFFIKRLRTTVFGDMSYVRRLMGTDLPVWNTLGSFGADIYADGHLLRMSSPVSIGVRGTCQTNTWSFGMQFFFSISLDTL